MSLESIVTTQQAIMTTLTTLKYMSYIVGAVACLAGFRIIKKIWSDVKRGWK